nr:C39 family peptidase [Sedimentibacter sp.]
MDWICEGEDLYKNEIQNLAMSGEYLKLKQNYEEGYMVTPVIEVPGFTQISPSWNSKTDRDSSVELLIRIKIGKNWTSYISYGIWSTDGNNIGINKNQSDEFVKVTTDRIFVCNDKFADAVQIKVIFRGNGSKIRLIAFTTDSGEKEDLNGNYLKVIDNVPMISQLASGHKDSHSICSPTSLTMVLKYYGIPVELDDVTNGTFDTGSELYGNWPQNSAYAGEQGMRAYTKKCVSINAVKNLIAKDIPVVASVVSKEKEELDGAISAFPSGHLMVVIGFKIVDGEEYIVVNDPAANTDEEVRKYYKLDQWIKVWRHYIYIVTKY